MNIAIFTDTFTPQINGVATSTMLLERELTKRGHNVFIFTTSDPNAPPKQERVFRMASVAAPFSPNNRIGMFFSPRALARIGRLKLDIVHTQTEFTLGVLGKVVSEFTRAPMVHTYHTMYEDYVHYIAGGRVITKNAARRYSRLFCNRARVVTTPVEKAKASLLRYGVKVPVRVIPTGIDFAPFARGRYSADELSWTRGSLGIPRESPVAVSIGRLAKEKSLDAVLRGWPAVLARVPNARLAFIGDGPFAEEMKQLAADLGVSESVVFAGSRPWAEIGKYYQLGDVFVSASTSETQGLTYIEAMAAKTPVCVRRDDSIAGIVVHNKTGWFFNGEADLAQTLAAALSDKARRAAISEAAFENIQPLSVGQFGAAMEGLYLDLIQANPKQPLQ